MCLKASLDHAPEAMATILRIGTSAGGARAKAVVSWNPETNEILSGQIAPPPGFEGNLLPPAPRTRSLIGF